MNNQMNKETIKQIALDCGFKLKEQANGEMDLNPYVYEFANAIAQHCWSAFKIGVMPHKIHPTKASLNNGWISVDDVENKPPVNQDILVWLTSDNPDRSNSLKGIATDRYFDDEYKGFGFECRNNLRDNKVYVTHWHIHPINNNLITLYRAMCQEEYNSVSSDTPFVWHGKAKWFTDNLSFIQERVLDGKFNNSNHKPKRYTHLVKYELENLNGFSRISNNELMLKRKDVPLTSVKQVIKLGVVGHENY